jgi:BirA family biotin operon repressor/biotin-[acetyl-CoA-carboxylase] ligase
VKRALVIRAHLDQSKISSAIPSNYWRVRVLQEVGSTQDELKNELVSNGDCVVAEFQSAGRGRLDRSFESEPSVALLFSFYIKPTRISEWGWIPLIAGIAVAQTLNEVTMTQDFVTKWPNDVLSKSGKVCGILCERFGDGVIVGIGVNVTTKPDELPVKTASSIFITTGLEIDRNDLLAKLLLTFQEHFLSWESGIDLMPRYRALSETIGREVSVLLPDSRTIQGRATGITSDGELLLESGDVISVGDLHHLR